MGNMQGEKLYKVRIQGNKYKRVKKKKKEIKNSTLIFKCKIYTFVCFFKKLCRSYYYNSISELYQRPVVIEPFSMD